MGDQLDRSPPRRLTWQHTASQIGRVLRWQLDDLFDHRTPADRTAPGS